MKFFFMFNSIPNIKSVKSEHPMNETKRRPAAVLRRKKRRDSVASFAAPRL